MQRDRRVVGKQAYWRLRFRFRGRSRTVYLGADNALVESVRRELAELQTARHALHQLSRDVDHGRQVLRTGKARLKPILAELGFHFHGDTIRKCRDAEKHTGLIPGSGRG